MLFAIDASSNKVAAGVIFNVNPPDSGTIMCDNQSGTSQIEYPINGYIYVDNGTRCTGQGKNNYEFDRWVLDLGHNSSLTINDASDLRVDRYGNFTAYFKPVPPSVPPQYWSLIITVVITTIVGWSIPGFIGWYRETTKRKESVKEYDDIVVSLSNATDRQNLDRINNQVIRAYISEKINEFQYKALDKKISDYYNIIDKSNNSANQQEKS